MMEKLGQAKTHLELKKMISEVDTTNSGQFFHTILVLPSLNKAFTYLLTY